MRRPCATRKGMPCSQQLEKGCAQQPRPRAATQRNSRSPRKTTGTVHKNQQREGVLLLCLALLHAHTASKGTTKVKNQETPNTCDIS